MMSVADDEDAVLAGTAVKVQITYLSGPHYSAMRLQYKKKLLYCSCIVVVLHLCGPLYENCAS